MKTIYFSKAFNISSIATLWFVYSFSTSALAYEAAFYQKDLQTLYTLKFWSLKDNFQD